MMKIKFETCKTFAIISLITVLLFTLFGCGNSINENNITNNNELYSKAIAILDEFNGDQRIEDFRNAYDLLRTLPRDKKKFVSQLSDANVYFEKYGVELHWGNKYLKSNAMSYDQENFDHYRAEGASVDATNLLQAIVYPVLFEKYGDEAQSIKGITAQKVISAINSTNDYALDKKTENYDGCIEEWKYIGTPSTKYEVKYHSNGLIEHITIPIVTSDAPLSNDEFIAFFNKNAETQKQIAGNRFISMSNQLSTISTRYEVLSQIFTDEEIAIIYNYIHSLTVEEIWERNLYAIAGEPADYFGAIVVLNYKGNSISITYGLDDISLNITGNNLINALSSCWHTLRLGLDWYLDEATIESYSDYINNNTAINSTVPDYSFNLDANADSFAKAPNINTEQTQETENAQDVDVQQSIPLELSISQRVTIYGIVEQNDAEFPAYRLRLTPQLTVIFDEYIGEKVFECEYMYFYDDAELNNHFPIHDFVGYSCEVATFLEDYKGGNELFLLNPTITNVFSNIT